MSRATNSGAQRAMSEAATLLSTVSAPKPAAERGTASPQRARSRNQTTVDELFDMLDADKDGGITMDEMRAALAKDDGRAAMLLGLVASDRFGGAKAASQTPQGGVSLSLSPARSPARSPRRSPARTTSSATGRPHQLGTWGELPATMGQGGSRTTSAIRSGRDGYDRSSTGRYYSMLLASASPGRYSRQAGATVRDTDPYKSPIRNLPKIEMRVDSAQAAAAQAEKQAESAAKAAAEADAAAEAAAKGAEAALKAVANWRTSKADGDARESAAQALILKKEAELATREAALARKEAQLTRQQQQQQHFSQNADTAAQSQQFQSPPRSRSASMQDGHSGSAAQTGSLSRSMAAKDTFVASGTPMQQYLDEQAAKKAAATEAKKQALLAARRAAVESKPTVPTLPPRSDTERQLSVTVASGAATARGEVSPSGAVAGYRVAAAGAASQGLQDRRVNAVAETRARLFPQQPKAGSRWTDDSTYRDMKARVATRRAEMVEQLDEHKFVMTSALPLHGGGSGGGRAAVVYSPRSSGAAGSGKLTVPTPEKPIVYFN